MIDDTERDLTKVQVKILRRLDELVSPIDPDWKRGSFCFVTRPDRRQMLIVNPTHRLFPAVNGLYRQEPGETSYVLTPANAPVSEAHVLAETLDVEGASVWRRTIGPAGIVEEEHAPIA